MDLKDAKSVKKYNDEFMDAIKELSGRPEHRRSILNQAKFHSLEDTGKRSYFISDTRKMHKEDFVSRNKLDFYYEIHDNHMKMMDDACRLVIARCLEYCAIQGDHTKNELEFDGLIRSLTSTPVKDLDTLMDEHFSSDKPMITFTYGEDDVREYGGVIVADDNNFDGIDVYGSAHKYNLSEDLFTIVWHGYVEFSPELINKLTLYTYPIGEDGATV